MQKFWSLTAMLSLSLGLSGCVFSGHQDITRAQAMMLSMDKTVARAVKPIESSVVLVAAEGKFRSQKNSVKWVHGRLVRGGNSVATIHIPGIVLDQDGHILVSEIMEPDTTNSIKIWLEEEEYPARIIKSDKYLQMTVLKVDTDEKLIPLSFPKFKDLRPGSYSLSIEPTGENLDFVKFYHLSICSGIIDGRYRQFKNDRAVSSSKGSPAVNLKGELVGIQLSGSVIAMSDIYEDLSGFIKDATGEKKNGEKSAEKSWLGAGLAPINKEYAKLRGLPKSGIWVHYALADSPAAAAGVKGGDLVVGVNGRELRFRGARSLDLFNKILRPKVDAPFSIAVIRDGKKVICKGTFTKKPEDETLRAEDLGVTVKQITEADTFGLNLFAPAGVLVTNVKQGSPAANSGSMGRSLLGKNYVITELAGQPTPDLETFTRVLEEIRRDQPDVLLVQYWRGRTTGYAGLNLKIGDQGNGGSK